MYNIKQDFLVDQNKIQLEIEADSHGAFKEKYLESSKDFTNQGPFSTDQGEFRIFVDVKYYSLEDKKRKELVIRSISPIFEIALDNTCDTKDVKYLLNYINYGGHFKDENGFFRLCLGDSNSPDISLAAINLFYSLVYNEANLKTLEKEFEGMRPQIVEGAYNSASFNGLQGYYYSKYFVRWLLIFKHLALLNKACDQEDLEALFTIIEQLETPKEHFKN